MNGPKRPMIRGTFFQCGVLATGKKRLHVDLSLIVYSFELLTVLSSKDQSRLTDCDSQVNKTLQKLKLAFCS